ncbi:MAG: hypothetical protein U0871_05365 [Gemmataceae bacterium]
MPKTPSVRYFPTRSGYYTCFWGKQLPLAKGLDDKPTGPGYLAALKKFTELMETANAAWAGQENTVRPLCELYGQHLERNARRGSLHILKEICESALERFGDLTIAEFEAFHVTEWLEAMALPRRDSKGRTGRWNETYKNMAARTLVCALN